MKEKEDYPGVGKHDDKSDLFERRGWRTSMGFYLTVLLSSFAIINLWRFPYIVIENGGGAFLYVYFFLAAVVGSCFIMAELLMGKMAQRSLWGAFERWTSDRLALSSTAKSAMPLRAFYKLLRRLVNLSVWVSILVSSYFTVIGSWVLSYLVHLILSLVWPEQFSPKSVDASEDNFWLQFLFGLVHVLIIFFMVRRRIVQQSHRSLVRIAYGAGFLFLGLLLLLCYHSLTLPNAADSIRFLLYPDFTRVTFASLQQAVGHMTISLGLGLGLMSTFGTYFKSNRDITAAGSKVMTSSLVLSVVSLLIVCPMVLGAPYAVFGPRLVFQTLPQLIMKFPEGELFLVAFYFSFYVLSLVVGAGILESLVFNCNDRFKWAPSRALLVGTAGNLTLMVFPILASTVWRHFRWAGGTSLLESADAILINYILPILALGLALSALLVLPSKLVKREFVGPEIDQEISQFFPIWRAVILWLAPVLVLLALVMRVLHIFKY